MRRILLTLLVAIIGAYAAWYGLNPYFEKKTPQPEPSNLSVATELKVSKPLINFSLTDTDQKTFTQNSLLGHWTLLFFGYTQCPEICPRTLTTLNEAWKLIPSHIREENALRFVFISLDPDSDTVETVRAFLNRFNSNFIGLIGEESVIEALSKASSIYYWQDPTVNKPGPKMIDHSATLLLINPQGRLQALFSPPHEQKAIAEDLQKILTK